MVLPSMTCVEGEDNDLGYDLILAHRLKRRSIADQNVELESLGDGTPRKTLQSGIETADSMLNPSQITPDVVNGNQHNNKTDGVDADYARFLSLMIRDVAESEVADCMGCVDSNCNNIDVAIPYSTQNNDDSLLDGMKLPSMTEADDDADYAHYLKFMRCDDVAEGEVDINDNNIDDDNAVDPQYKIFLANIKEDGKSYVLQVPSNDEIPILLKYEEERSSYGRETNLAADNWQRKFGSTATRKKTDSHKRKSDVLGKLKIEKPTNLVAENITNQKRKSPMVEKNDEVNHAGQISNRTNIFKRPKLKPHFNKGINNVIQVDADYQIFLSGLKQDCDNLLFIDKMGQKVMYNEDRQNSLDPKVDDECQIIEKGDKNHGSSQFREMLMDVLRKRHDDKECDDLMKEVSRKRPIEHHRESRSGKINPRILPNTPWVSSLDREKRLSEKIDEAQPDQRKVLYLLRGYFFWLQYCFMDGNFAPWLDTECLRMMP